MVTTSLMTMPCELHLEILRRCDLTSLSSLLAVNRHFNNLVIDNQQFLARTMRDYECIGPHAILSKSTPSERSVVPDYRRIRTIQRSKSETAAVLRECKLAETDANTEAVHCIRYAIDRLIDYWVFGPGCLPNESADVLHGIFRSEFTVTQLQLMLVVSLRLIFTIASVFGHWRRGTTLSLRRSMKYNSNLIEYGPGIVATLAKLPVEKRVERRLYYCRTENNWLLFHGKLLCYLQSKGDGLVIEPLKELLQFFRENDTSLDTARSNDWGEGGDWIGWD
jgi:hypothetical protein